MYQEQKPRYRINDHVNFGETLGRADDPAEIARIIWVHAQPSRTAATDRAVITDLKTDGIVTLQLHVPGNWRIEEDVTRPNFPMIGIPVREHLNGDPEGIIMRMPSRHREILRYTTHTLPRTLVERTPGTDWPGIGPDVTAATLLAMDAMRDEDHNTWTCLMPDRTKVCLEAEKLTIETADGEPHVIEWYGSDPLTACALQLTFIDLLQRGMFTEDAGIQ